MKRLSVAALVVLLGTLVDIAVNNQVSAQAFGSFGIGPIAPLVSNCTLSAKGEARLCPVGSSGSFQLYISYDGGSYTQLGSFTTLTCPTSNTGNSGLSASGCAEK
jgi:hypothetical protein